MQLVEEIEISQIRNSKKQDDILSGVKRYIKRINA